ELRLPAQLVPLIRIAREIEQQAALGKDRRVETRDDVRADRADRLDRRNRAVLRGLEELAGPALGADLVGVEARHKGARAAEALEVVRILVGTDEIERRRGPFEHALAAFRLEPDEMRDRLHGKKARKLLHGVELARIDQLGDARRDHRLE